MIAKISLSPVFPFRFFWLNFILSSISLCVCWPERFRGTQAQCSFYCNRRSERLGRLHGRSPADPYPQFGPSDRLRRSVRKCPLSGPACNPSRTAIFTGISPHVSGLYRNEQKMRGVMPDVELLPKTFSKAGYWSGGSGKMLHYFIDAPSWDEYFPREGNGEPFSKDLGATQASG